jgi:hypothetical protein
MAAKSSLGLYKRGFLADAALNRRQIGFGGDGSRLHRDVWDNLETDNQHVWQGTETRIATTVIEGRRTRDNGLRR